MEIDYNLVLMIYNLMFVLLVVAIPTVIIIKVSKWLVKSVSRNIIPHVKK